MVLTVIIVFDMSLMQRKFTNILFSDFSSRMPTFKIKVKWGKEVFQDVEVNTDEEPMVFKAQLYALTGVQPERQKVMLKGAMLDNSGWGKVVLRDNAMVLMMGTKDEDMPTKPVEATKFIEDMDERELSKAMDMPAGLQNLGNTCYMNAVIQCLKSVPELRGSLSSYHGRVNLQQGSDAESITAALRDLYKTMDTGATIPPIIMLQVLHSAFPAFAERGEQGGYQQQDANECWMELMKMLQQKTKAVDNSKAANAVEQFFGIECQSQLKCVESESEEPSFEVEKFLQFSCYIDKDVKYLYTGLKNRLQENLQKHSVSLDRNAEFLKTLSITRLPGYLTIQMVRFHFKQKEGVNAKVLKDVKFPVMLDMFDMCNKNLQDRLVPMRTKFKEYEDWLVEHGSKDKGKTAALKQEKLSQDLTEAEVEDWWFEDDKGSNNSGYYSLQAVLTHKGRSSNSGHYVG
ncbi:ubiquitin carboxyl-terminal hydrolase 14 isoform X1 [Eurytemora carolleeae]|uniref:ubiquitin carboxyl-terminal hydrolase 14 isoform X1 n=1 Tax=Eurytemora carolleeae TaxID=1294199 RepID=UPI000C7694A5|nr:ubiquitin carboxyl-terminal hydrolase 14 isoform X1 [Eurytemora carolleeae]XP_023349064.1 ubiquitin carboxyl-terminal hydrolase 14 isoform X2 [Eurytemora carolleeae]XP_023349065.1 ubiquitin carboxyl-terminal hydrolase 14 isoform X1 [Eurytemora carolleeae]|eukprot:XP_023349063.1 ubiquitin carboxyl-terminal hydrolase 14-like isoform X1 [Eurytemora affinis]